MTSSKKKVKKNIIDFMGPQQEITKNDSGYFGTGDYNILELHVSTIKMENQIRQNYNQESIDELSESIKSQGLIYPIEVRKNKNDDEKYRIISGHRRFLALKKLGWEKIPSIIKLTVKNEDILIRQLIENIQREDLSPIEEAEAYKELKEKLGLSQREIGNTVGKSENRISYSLKYLTLLEKLPRAEVYNLPKRILDELVVIKDAPFFDDIFEKISKDLITSDELREEIRIAKSKNVKEKMKRKKELLDHYHDIFTSIKEFNEKIMRFKIRYGSELTEEIETDIRAKINNEIMKSINLIAALFEGKATISANITISKPKSSENGIDIDDTKLTFPGTSTKVSLSNKLVSISFSFIEFDKKLTIDELKEFIKEKIPNFDINILNDFDADYIIDHWNALPFQKIEKSLDGFLYKALKDNYNLPRKYLNIKNKSLGLNKERVENKSSKQGFKKSDPAAEKAKAKGYTFEK